MKNSKNKVIAAAVCGVIVGSVTTAIFGDFDVEKEVAENKKEEKETVELVNAIEDKNDNKEKVETNKDESKNDEDKIENNISNENDDNSQKEDFNSNDDGLVNNIVQENVNTGSESSANTNISTGNLNGGGSTNNTNGGNESNVQNPSDNTGTEPDIKDEPTIETPPPAPVPEPTLTYYDGSYIGSAIGYDMGLQVKVDIYLDKIARVTVVSHNETIGICDKALELIPYRITASQSTNVDVVSGATLTSNGIINAVNSALSQAIR